MYRSSTSSSEGSSSADRNRAERIVRAYAKSRAAIDREPANVVAAREDVADAVPRRNVEESREADEQIGEVLTHSVALPQDLVYRRVQGRGFGVVGEFGIGKQAREVQEWLSRQ